jgi:dTDP-4-amino-4,6-dideoxygalactose transaminase
MIPLYKVNMRLDGFKAVADTLQSGYVGEGPKVREFENAFAHWLGLEGSADTKVLATNSCTSALHLALHLAKPPFSQGFDGEVLVSPLTCFAGISAILANGYRIRWVDVDDYGNMSIDDLRRKISPTSKVIFVTHFAGYPVDMQKIYKLADERHLWVIEDCAHAIGSEYNGAKIGGGDEGRSMRCFSFQAVKPLTTVDGGALVVPMFHYDRAKLLRWYGLDREEENRYEQNILESGYKFHMNDVAASIGLMNMEILEQTLETQNHNREFLLKNLPDNYRIWPLHPNNTTFRSRCNIFPVWVENRLAFERAMKAREIEAAPAHGFCQHHSCVARYQEALPMAHDLEFHLTSLPAGWWVTEKDLEHIVEAVKAGW